MGDVHRCVHSHTYAHINTPHTHTQILEGEDMPYVVPCKFVILQLQSADKVEMLRIADNMQVKKPEYPVYVVYQKLVTSATSWYDFILSNRLSIMAENFLRY